jgi:uncharacterized protein (DUF1330 family)
VGSSALIFAPSAAMLPSGAKDHTERNPEMTVLDHRRGQDEPDHAKELKMAVEPTPEQIAALAARPADEPVVMVNLLKFRADSGRENYVRYVQEAAAHLARVGGTVLFAGDSPGVVIGEEQTPWWDAILLVPYPTPAAFLDMVTNEDFGKVHENRDNALDRGDLIATSTWTMAG